MEKRARGLVVLLGAALLLAAGASRSEEPASSWLLHDVSFHVERDDDAWGVTLDPAYWGELSVGTGVEALLHPSDWAWLSSRVTRYQSGLAYDRFIDSELGLEYARTLGRGVEGYLWVAGAHRRYDTAFDPGIGAQEDWRLGASGALVFSWDWLPEHSLELRYDYERNRSNDPLMHYDDQRIGVYWTWEGAIDASHD